MRRGVGLNDYCQNSGILCSTAQFCGFFAEPHAIFVVLVPVCMYVPQNLDNCLLCVSEYVFSDCNL
jgi:hypothetical protein